MKPVTANPQLPRLLALLPGIMPASLRDSLLLVVLNKLFSDNLKSAELDFLHQRIVCIHVTDASLKFSFSMRNAKLINADYQANPDLVLAGSVYNYMLLASRSEDVDTLFFKRSLSMQGDTELGLQLKNFLDAVDVDANRAASLLSKALAKSLPLYQRLVS